jgi:TatD DNase family protein
MFSDTHFHLLYLCEKGIDAAPILRQLAERGTEFALDIGTKPDDIGRRIAVFQNALDATDSPDIKEKIKKFLAFSMGIWPAKEAIEDRENAVRALERSFRLAARDSLIAHNVAALGECGLDHHWNPSGVDGRGEGDFDKKIISGEAELFEAQLELGRSLGLPVIVHSREAFEGTLSCIDNVGYHRGVIHCFSYDIPEARAFLDRGWHISFSGAITYTKNARLDSMRALVGFVPRDRILIETDAPFLAPVPYRGKPNTPVWVEHVYRFAASCLETTPEALSALVDENAAKLFSRPAGC